jgi:hypothetical protein
LSETLISSYGFRMCSRCEKRFSGCVFAIRRRNRGPESRPLMETTIEFSEDRPLMRVLSKTRKKYLCIKKDSPHGSIYRVTKIFLNKIIKTGAC